MAANQKYDHIMRPERAKRLGIRERDVFRWLFWKRFGRRSPTKSEIASLKEQMMKDDWNLIDRVRSDGRLGWGLRDIWFRIRCRLSSNAHDLDTWICYRNADNSFNGIVDEEKDKKYARERLEVLRRRASKGELCMYELEDAAHCYETLGDKASANKYYRKILDEKLKGTKWPEPQQ